MMIKILALLFIFQPFAQAAINGPALTFLASNVKRNQYHSNAVIWGGDALANPMALENVRWAPNTGFERIVIDLAGETSNWESKIPPYFQIGLSDKERKILVSVRSISRRGLSSEKLSKSLARSSLVASTYLAPSLEGDLASFEIKTHKAVAVEAFYLVNPPRIILDIRAAN